ncbi:hypothetical protein CK215_26865 [Mesorhizobium sp. WSM3864]|nr:hypothetical protein CK215_26865 [Mesorhizobium sp. WSM3864]
MDEDSSLVPIPVKGNFYATGIQSSLRLARKAGITHALVTSPPPHLNPRRSKKGKPEFGLIPISDIAPLAQSGESESVNTPKPRLDEHAFVVLDVSNSVRPDEHSMWEGYGSREARWRCYQDLSWFEASPRLWEIFGYPRREDESDHPREDMDLIERTADGAPHRHWPPYYDYRGSYPFRDCFRIEKAIGCENRWIVSVIYEVGSWYVGIVEDITERLSVLGGLVRFEIPETRNPHLGSEPNDFRPGVLVRLL